MIEIVIIVAFMFAADDELTAYQNKVRIELINDDLGAVLSMTESSERRSLVPELYFYRGEALFRSGRLEEARGEFDRAIKSGVFTQAALLRNAEIAITERRAKDAIAILERVRADFGASIHVATRQAFALATEGCFDQAKDELRNPNTT